MSILRFYGLVKNLKVGTYARNGEKMYSDNRNSPENRSAVRRFVEKTVLCLSFNIEITVLLRKSAIIFDEI